MTDEGMSTDWNHLTRAGPWGSLRARGKAMRRQRSSRWWRDPAIMAPALIGGVFGIVAALLAVALADSDTPLPEGSIEDPRRGQTVLERSMVTGTLTSVPDDQHAWLAVQRPGGVFFVGEELASRARRWERQLPAELSPGKSFALVLLLVGRDDAARIRDVQAGRPSQMPKELDDMLMSVDDLSRLTLLDLVSALVVRVKPRGEPLHSVFPQSRESRGVPFDFANRGGELTSGFTEASGCHRPHLAVGLRLEWKIRCRDRWMGRAMARRGVVRAFRRLAVHADRH
jgi:hypothetical protein